MDNELCKKLSSYEHDDNNHWGFCYLKNEIARLKRQVEWCNSGNVLPNDLLVHGFRYIESRISELVAENTKLLGFIRGPKFGEDEIKSHISCCVSLYMQDAVKDGIIYYDADDDCYYDENGVITENDYAETDTCHGQAYLDLYENYRANHPNGAIIDNQLFLLSFNCRNTIAQLQDQLSFIDSVREFSKKPKSLSLIDFIIKERQKILDFIDKELNACKGPQCKLIAIMIIALHKAGYMTYYKGKIKDIYNAFQTAYPGKIGAFTGIVDYINSHCNSNYSGDKQIKSIDLSQMGDELNNFLCNGV